MGKAKARTKTNRKRMVGTMEARGDGRNG